RHSLISISESVSLHAPPSFPTRRSSDLRSRPQHVVDDGDDVGQALARAGPGRQHVAPATLGSPDGVDLVPVERHRLADGVVRRLDRKSTRLNSSHVKISYAVFCLKKKRK